MNSPFKFLDAYTAADKEIFFGRDDEIDILYNLINRNRLVLVYGPSGTGKTSLLQCGLGNRFDETDWLPLLIRRGTNMLSSLQQALTDQWDEALDGNYWEQEENPLPEIIQDIFEEKLRPIYLIFDQLEEIFVLGSELERQVFTQSVADIYHAKLPCRLLFIIREEYLAHLYVFEKHIPALFDRRLRVEPMNIQKAKEVILQSCHQFNIELEDPENGPFEIIKKVSSGSAGVALPYLQVYLDRLYQDDFHRTYPNGNLDSLDSPSSYPRLEFTTEEIHEFGELGAILKSFLNDQIEQIQSKLSSESSNTPSRAVSKILGSFSTLQGTKIPRKKDELSISGLQMNQLQEILTDLEKARILREAEGLYELAHDTLAREIANQRTGEEEAVIRVSEMVKHRNQDFQELQTFLNQRELQRLEDVEDLLVEEQKLKEEEWNFVEASRQHIINLRRRARLRTLTVIAALSGLLIAAIVFGLDAKNTSLDLEESLQETKVALEQEEIAKGEAKIAQAKAEASRQVAEKALLDALTFKRDNLDLQKNDTYSKIEIYKRARLMDLVENSQRKFDSLIIAIQDIDSIIYSISTTDLSTIP